MRGTQSVTAMAGAGAAAAGVTGAASEADAAGKVDRSLLTDPCLVQERATASGESWRWVCKRATVWESESSCTVGFTYRCPSDACSTLPMQAHACQARRDVLEPPLGARGIGMPLRFAPPPMQLGLAEVSLA